MTLNFCPISLPLVIQALVRAARVASFPVSCTTRGGAQPADDGCAVTSRTYACAAHGRTVFCLWRGGTPTLLLPTIAATARKWYPFQQVPHVSGTAVVAGMGKGMISGRGGVGWYLWAWNGGGEGGRWGFYRA